MNERAERTNDVLGKLTVLGTIVLPMNIVTGMWGMNVLGENLLYGLRESPQLTISVFSSGPGS